MKPATSKTVKLIKKALKSPKLAPSGSPCLYVRQNGQHCIVGEVLSLCGVPDEALLERVNGNGQALAVRDDLKKLSKKNGLDIDLLSTVQSMFDRSASVEDVLP